MDRSEDQDHDRGRILKAAHRLLGGLPPHRQAIAACGAAIPHLQVCQVPCHIEPLLLEARRDLSRISLQEQWQQKVWPEIMRQPWR